MLNNGKWNDYLNKVCSQVKFKRTHKGIRKELEAHLEDQIQEYIDNSIDEKEAVKMAMQEMGDPIMIGQQLDEVHKPQTDWVMMIATALLIGFGVFTFVTIQDASPFIAVNPIKYYSYLTVGIMLLIGLYFFDYTWLKKYPYSIYGLGFLFILLGIIYGQDRAIFSRLDYFAAILFIIGFAGILEKSRNTTQLGFFKVLVLAMIPILLNFIYPREIMAVCLAISFIFLIFISISRRYYGKEKKTLTIFTFLSLVFLAVYSTIHVNPKVFHHLRGFLSPENDPYGLGYISMQIRGYINHAQLIGRSNYQPYPNRDIFHILPEVQSDYVLTYLIAMLGWFAGIVMIIISCLFIFRFIRIASRIRYGFGYNLSVGLGIFLGVQFFVSVLGNLGVIPLISSYGFPFISLGGTGFLGNIISVGLLMSVWRSNQILKEDSSQGKEPLERLVRNNATRTISAIK